MGRQLRKVAPWLGTVEAHLHSNHTTHRMYRWTTYHSHPKDRVGAPFKGRCWGRPTPGVLLTPDALKYKIPMPIAFVPADPSVNPRNEHVVAPKHENRIQLLSAGNFKNEVNCQKTVNNFNKCLLNASPDDCLYYMSYLQANCKLNQ